MVKKRKKREEEGKGSAFRLRGALVDDSKIARYEKKTMTGDEHEIAEAGTYDLNIFTFLVHNANRQLGTPGELSCFTPSPVASSPIVSSPVLWHLKSPNLLGTSIVSPSEQAFQAPSCSSSSSSSSSHVSPESSNLLDLTFPEFTTALKERLASWESVKLDIFSRDFNDVDDFTSVTICAPMKHFEKELSKLVSLDVYSSLPKLGSCFIESAGQRTMFSKIQRFALVDFVLFRKLYDYGVFRGSTSQLKPASTDSAFKNFPDSLQISHATTSSDVRGGPSGFELSVTALECEIVVKFSSLTSLDLEQKHNPDNCRRESFESTRSLSSFLSDSVVDWKELLYGYNQ